MKLNRLSAFTLGVVITASSVGAVSFVNAAGNRTLKACASKTTGSLRYISKGSCKKTETSLSWNQVGPAGTPGVNGQNLHVIDDKGQDLGLLVSHDQSQITVLLKDKIWDLDIYESNSARGNFNIYDNFYTDAVCTKNSPVVRTLKSPAQSVLVMAERAWAITSIELLSNQSNIYEKLNMLCTRLNAARIVQLESNGLRVAVVEELQTPTYTAPLTIVAK